MNIFTAVKYCCILDEHVCVMNHKVYMSMPAYCDFAEFANDAFYWKSWINAFFIKCKFWIAVKTTTLLIKKVIEPRREKYCIQGLYNHRRWLEIWGYD